MFENPRRGRQARNFTTNVPKILDLKSSSEQIFSRKLPLGALGFNTGDFRRLNTGQANSFKLTLSYKTFRFAFFVFDHSRAQII